MGYVSVSQAAQRLGVGVSRVHRRIADGSLPAERIGSQWVIDERALLRVAERTKPGRPLSARSAWAIVALAEDDRQALAALAPVERSRAEMRLHRLLSFAVDPPTSEGEVQRVASMLRLTFRNRAERLLRRAAPADLPRLRDDERWQSLVTPAASGIASFDVDGYLARRDVEPVTREHLLVPAVDRANVVIHVLPAGQRSYPGSPVLLAADLADRRGPRDELRAASLLHTAAVQRRVVTT